MCRLLLRLVCWCAAVAVGSTGTDAGRGLIVKFSRYAPASAHELTLAACVSAANGFHRVIERRNPAARLPTDFLVVEFPPADLDRLARALRVRSCPCSVLRSVAGVSPDLAFVSLRTGAPRSGRRAYSAAVHTPRGALRGCGV